MSLRDRAVNRRGTKAKPGTQRLGAKGDAVRELLDTSGLDQSARGLPTKALILVNEGEIVWRGVGALHADFFIADALPVAVFDPAGNVVPSRLVQETLGPRDEARGGKRRWRFVLEFFVDIPAHSAIAYGAVFGDLPGSHASARAWELRRLGGIKDATEAECRAGSLPNPAPLPR